MSQYSEDRAALSTLFPRGRFTQDDDRRCVLTARQTRRAKDFLYVQDPGRKLGIFYVGRGQVYRNALRGLILEEIEADGEGIIHAKWCAETAERLPWFNKAKPRNPQGVGGFAKPSLQAGSRRLKVPGQATGHREGTEASQEVTL